MRYSPPTTDEEKRLYSQFSGLLLALTIGRWIVQYGIWLPVATIAAAKLCQDYLGQYTSFQPITWKLLSLILCTGLHWLLSKSYKTHWFHRWDKDPKTNDGIVLPIGLALCLLFLDFKALQHQFHDTVAKPVPTSTTVADSLATLATTGAAQEYERLKDAIEASADHQEKLLAGPTLSEMARLERWKPTSQDDKAYRRNRLKALRSRLDNDRRIVALHSSTAARLDSLLTGHQSELAAIRNSKATNTANILKENGETEARYQASLESANRYAGMISLFCALVFFYCARREVRIRTWCGMFPTKHYTDLDGYGNLVEKLVGVLADVASRLLHRFITWLHEIGSGGEITDLDGRLNIRPGDYQGDTKAVPNGAKVNGAHHPMLDESGKN
jgi:hypothetical protein